VISCRIFIPTFSKSTSELSSDRTQSTWRAPLLQAQFSACVNGQHDGRARHSVREDTEGERTATECASASPTQWWLPRSRDSAFSSSRKARSASISLTVIKVSQIGPRHDVLIQENQDDALFLIERANRIDFDCYVSIDPDTGRDTLYFTSQSGRDGKTQRVYVFEWGKSLISFNPVLSTKHNAIPLGRTLVSLTDTSSPAKWFMLRFSF